MSNLQRYSQPHKVGIPSKSGIYYLVRDVDPILNSLQQLKAEIAAYTKEVMDKIDDAKDRGAANDLSVIAYALVNKLIAATSAV